MWTLCFHQCLEQLDILFYVFRLLVQWSWLAPRPSNQMNECMDSWHRVQAFMLNGNEVERVESHKYLGFVFHANKCLARDGVSQLVSAAKKATRSMNHRCVLTWGKMSQDSHNSLKNTLLPKICVLMLWPSCKLVTYCWQGNLHDCRRASHCYSWHGNLSTCQHRVWFREWCTSNQVNVSIHWDIVCLRELPQCRESAKTSSCCKLLPLG